MSKDINNLNIDELYKLIGKNVAKYRIKANMSQLELSLEMGNKSSSLLSAAELYANKRKFNIAQLHKIAKILNIDICEFFKGK
ncbi:helix-turn-helix domain-containing protein [Aliarcobacter skirrowii]|uniref:helix-turn-helix domain-containing protein n=1 Tax=Aliarcobacter skirrowii TaxID=28200 RepID=UPI001402E108|nr:helix-turn-helix transcriptional regulator [Aliarcobacter skirrowii]